MAGRVYLPISIGIRHFGNYSNNVCAPVPPQAGSTSRASRTIFSERKFVQCLDKLQFNLIFSN
jgi:hypothetical protein